MSKLKHCQLVLIIPTNKPSGVLTHALGLNKLLVGTFGKIEIYSPGKTREDITVDNVIVKKIDVSYSIPRIPITWLNTLFFTLRLLLAGQKVVFHLHGRMNLIAFAPSVLMFGKSFVYTIHQFEKNDTGFTEMMRSRFEKILMKRVAENISVSLPLKNEVDTFGVKSEVIENWFDDESAPRCFTEIRKEPMGRVFLFLGRLSDEKNPAAVMEAAMQLKKAGFNNTLLVYGHGLLESDLKNKFYDASNIEFRGATLDPLGVIDQSDCVIVPSVKESFGLVALEAIFRKKWIIASNCNGMSEIFEGSLHKVIEPSPENISHEMRKFLEKGVGEIKSVIDAEYARVEERYGIARARNEYRAFYERNFCEIQGKE